MILLQVLADDVTESGNGIQRDHKFWWTDPKNVIEYFEQVKSVLDARAHVCRDLTHATYTKQNKGKTASACVGRKTLVFRINTCLNNMNPDLARLVRVTSANLMQQTVEDFC